MPSGKPLWRRALRAGGIAFGGLLIAFAVYRVGFVYTYRTGNCSVSLTPPPRVAPQPAGPFDREIVVMSWNIEGHAALIDDDHVEEVAAVIRRHHPDIVGLQEVHRGTWQARFRDQVSELSRLTGMQARFGPSLRIGRGAYGNAVLTRGAVARAALQPLPAVGEPRSLLEIWTDVDGHPVAFFTTHLVTWGGFNRKSRKEQLACIGAHLATTTVPWVLTGDLNAQPEDPEIAELRGSEVMLQADPKAATHRITHQQLDYIFVDPRVSVLWSRVLDEGPSDHRPVLAGLKLLSRSKGAGA